MSVNVRTYKTTQFLDLFPYLAAVIGLGMVAAFLAAFFQGKLLISRTVLVEPEEVLELPAFTLRPAAIGALRLDVTAVIPANRWLTYEIQLRDAQGKIIASGIKQAWSETGTWREEGESGTWAEDDLQSGLDVRADRAEPMKLAIDILDYTDTSGKDLDQSVSFRVKVWNGVVDTRYLWAGLLGTLVLVVLAFKVVPSSGRTVIHRTINDSDIGDRAEMGGDNRLLRVIVTIKADETCPRFLDLDLFVKDGNGDQIYHTNYVVGVSYSKTKEGRVTGATGRLQAFFLLQSQGSYGFYVEVTPDQSVDSTTLTVRQGTHTLAEVEVIHLGAA